MNDPLRLDNRATDRETRLGGLRFGGEECIEDLLRVFCRQSHTGVAD